MHYIKKILFISLILSLLVAQNVFAAFSDVPPVHDNYNAITYLESKGIIEGYPDGTFRPSQYVIRAEAVKIIIAPLYESFEDPTENPFPDVSTDKWYAKFVKKAKDISVVTGDGVTGNFEGDRNVNLVEFLKILLLAFEVNLDNYQNPQEVIFNDISDLNQWYIPYLYYASATNLIHSDSLNNIYPGKSLTRGEVAEITYRLILNLQGGEVQLYLSMSEAEMIKTLQYLEQNDIEKAESSVAKALDYTNNALSLSPDETIVQAANKIAQAFDNLVKGYREGLSENYEQVITYAQQAWTLANEAQALNGSVIELAENIKDIAHDMAEDARNALEGA